MKDSSVDKARDTLLVAGHGFQAMAIVAGAIPTPCAKVASETSDRGLVEMADSVCSTDRDLATRECVKGGRQC